MWTIIVCLFLLMSFLKLALSAFLAWFEGSQALDRIINLEKLKHTSEETITTEMVYMVKRVTPIFFYRDLKLPKFRNQPGRERLLATSAKPTWKILTNQPQQFWIILDILRSGLGSKLFWKCFLIVMWVAFDNIIQHSFYLVISLLVCLGRWWRCGYLPHIWGSTHV